MQTSNSLMAQMRRIEQISDPKMLQQVASQYKSQPNGGAIVAAALARSQNLQRLAAGAQQQPPGPPGPKVADQAIEGMAPPAMENSGIAQLPAPNIEHMAAGGIVHFDEGGQVDAQTLGLVAAAAGGSAAAMASLNALAPGLGYPNGAAVVQALGKHAISSTAAKAAPVLTGARTAVNGTLGKTGVLGATAATVGDVFNTPTEDYRKRFGMETNDPSLAGDIGVRALGAASDLGNNMTLGLAGNFYRDKQEQPSAPKLGAATAQPTGATPQNQQKPEEGYKPDPMYGTAGGGAGMRTGISTIPQRPTPDFDITGTVRKEYATGLADLQRAQAERAKQRATNALPAEDFAERKAMLAEQAGEFAKSKDQATGLAFLSAAQAMVQGRQGTLQALVNGMAVGGKEYGAAMKDVKKAEKERKAAEVALAEAQRAAKRGEHEKAQEWEDKAYDLQQKYSMGATGAVASALGMDAKTRVDLFTSQQQRDTTLQAANIQANATRAAGNRMSPEMAMIDRMAREQNIPFTKAYEKYTSMKQEPKTRMEMMKDWDDMSKRMMIQQQYPQIKNAEDYYLAMTGGPTQKFELVN